jgi:hypothetical protein
MKFSLTITDASPSELSALLAHLGGSTAINIAHAGNTAPAAAAGEDEDNAPANTAAPAVDSTGLPHDERIHSKAKTVTDAGAWRKRKGVADSLVTAVEAELRARGAVPQQPAFAPPPQVTQPVAMPMPPMQPQQMPQPGYPTGPGYPQQPGNVQPGPLAATLPYQPQPPVQQPQQQPAPQPGTVDFNGFMQHLTGKMAQPAPDGSGMLVDAAYLQRVVGEISAAFQTQLTVITDISANPQMIGYAIQLMQRDGKW